MRAVLLVADTVVGYPSSLICRCHADVGLITLFGPTVVSPLGIGESDERRGQFFIHSSRDRDDEQTPDLLSLQYTRRHAHYSTVRTIGRRVIVVVQFSASLYNHGYRAVSSYRTLWRPCEISLSRNVGRISPTG